MSGDLDRRVGRECPAGSPGLPRNPRNLSVRATHPRVHQPGCRMAQITPPGIGDIGADPFFERSPYPFAMVKTILGARFRFDSTHAALLEPVEAAYGGQPHDVPGAQLPAFHVELRLSPRRLAAVRDEPPPVLTQSGAGLLCGIMDSSNYVI